jgi:hypothetical protein
VTREVGWRLLAARSVMTGPRDSARVLAALPCLDCGFRKIRLNGRYGWCDSDVKDYRADL